jgi:uncharacterized membrane protein
MDLTGAACTAAEARRIRRLWVLPPLMLGLAVLASILSWPYLPDEMPTHWGLSGEPTNLMPRGFAVAAMPGFMLWIGFLTGAILWSSTQTREGRDLPAWLSPVVTAVTMGTLLLLHLAMLGMGLGWGISVPLVSNLVVGALFIGMGWLSRDMPPNPVFGIRTPTTLACPEAWQRANRVGGAWMVGAGVVTILAAPLPGAWPIGVMMTSIVVACIVGIRAARTEPPRAPAGTRS